MNDDKVKFTNAYDLLKYAEHTNVVIAAPVDLDAIVGLLGLTVEYDSGLEDRDIIGEILFSEDRPLIKINPFQNAYKVRERFTLSHEIGHYCLHSSANKNFVDSRNTMSRSGSYWDKFESEANNFAAQLLMPKDLLISEGRKIIDAYKLEESKQSMPARLFVEQTSGIFGVSSKAMEYRLKNLGVISD